MMMIDSIGKVASNALGIPAVNMSAESAISSIEWLLGSGNMRDRDEALEELENYRDIIVARIGSARYNEMVRRAGNSKRLI